MQVEIDLLGIVNESSTPNSVLQRKYILRVTAEQISQWLQCERKGRAMGAPFRISPHSVITIDEEIQRGRDSEGYLLQQPKKIMEIASTLLNPGAATIPRLYLGSLIWNVRPKPGIDLDEYFIVQKVEQQNKPPRYRLSFDTEKIFLTDSAHRHLGIVEAVRRFSQNPSEYPKFNPKSEFAVELYTLNKTQERELFAELNGKQKKISAAKKKQMDVSSPIGSLNDAIQAYDRENERLFFNNIEVSSNQNDKHTLITMSVFVASINEMFSTSEIKESRDSEELRSELAAYYCDFFYALSRTITVRADLGNGEADYRPFRNLYLEIIRPAEDGYDAQKPTISDESMQAAVEKAKEVNRRLRAVDIANHNSFIKAWARLGGYIRHMEHWENVIYGIQTQHVVPSKGRFFQESNQELFIPHPQLGVSIATHNEDKTINVQVQSKTINAIFEYLIDKLQLRRSAIVMHGSVNSSSLLELRNGVEHIQTVPKEGGCFTYFVLLFYLPNTVTEWPDNVVRLEIDGGQLWKHVTNKGKAKALVSTACEIDETYVDEHYSDIRRWRATFEAKWPPGSTMVRDGVPIDLKFTFPLFDDPNKLASEERKMNFIIG